MTLVAHPLVGIIGAGAIGLGGIFARPAGGLTSVVSTLLLGALHDEAQDPTKSLEKWHLHMPDGLLLC